MTPPPPLPEDPRDREHLRLLSIFHYIYAGLGILGLLFIVAHFMLMRTVIASFEDLPNQIQEETITLAPAAAEPEQEPPIITAEGEPIDPESSEVIKTEEMTAEQAAQTAKVFGKLGSTFIIIYLVMAAFIILMMILNVISARWMTQRKGRIFSMVVSGFNLLSFPLGTALGVFTLVVLSRPSIETTYRNPQP